MVHVITFAEEVWMGALSSAEQEVMRATATPPGGRRENEGIDAYVERTRAIQEHAMERWRKARHELNKARSGGETTDAQNVAMQSAKDAARYRWLANDCDGNAQDDFTQWLSMTVASRERIDEEIDRFMAPGYRSRVIRSAEPSDEILTLAGFAKRMAETEGSKAFAKKLERIAEILLSLPATSGSQEPTKSEDM